VNNCDTLSAEKIKRAADVHRLVNELNAVLFSVTAEGLDVHMTVLDSVLGAPLLRVSVSMQIPPDEVPVAISEPA